MFCIKNKISPDFEADIDDIYSLICVFEGGIIGNITIDVITRPSSELFELVCTNGVIQYRIQYSNHQDFVEARDGNNGNSKIFKIDRGTPEDNYTCGEEIYIEEIKSFIECINSDIDYGYSIYDEINTIEVLLAAEQSAKEGRLIKI